MKEESITRGTQAEAIRALDRYHERQRKGPEPKQKQIDAESADLLRTTFCFKHGEPLKKYADNIWSCPECEADAVLDINYPVSPNAGMF